MINSPSQSHSGILGLILASGAGILLTIMGTKIVIRRETKLGPKGGPYKTVYGQEAIVAGLFFIFVGLAFLIPAVPSIIELFH